MYPSKIPFSRDLEDVCPHTQKPDKKFHTEKYTQLWTHRNAYTQVWTQKYMQLFTHRNTVTQLRTLNYGHRNTIMDSCKNTHRHTQKYTYKKKYTDTYTNPHVKIHTRRDLTHIYTQFNTQHLDSICPSTFASLKPLWVHTQSRGLLSSHVHLLPQPPPPSSPRFFVTKHLYFSVT